MVLQNDSNGITAKDSDGSIIGEINFFMSSKGVYKIKRTYVDPSQRGKGIADQLMGAAIKKISGEGAKVIPACSYAAKWMDRHPEHAGMVVPRPQV